MDSSPQQTPSVDPLAPLPPGKKDVSLAGLRIVGLNPGTGYCLEITSDRPREPWKVYTGLSHQPAPAIRYRGGYFAIADIQKTPHGMPVYYLTPWPEQARVLSTIDLSPEAWAEQLAEKADEAKYRARSQYWLPLELTIGWLPTRIQNRISFEASINTLRATYINAAIQLMIAMFVFLVAFWDKNMSLMGVVVWQVIEAFVRAGWTLTEEEPVGLLPLEFLDRLVTLIRTGGNSPG